MPPSLAGPVERRLQFFAYETWACLLGDDRFPVIAHLVPGLYPDFSAQSVLFDFTKDKCDPSIMSLGTALAAECGMAGDIAARVSQLPKRSLLERIAQHYLLAIAGSEPLGFEAEFINQRARTILYRGILLPFSHDGHAIDFVFGAISWKEADEHGLVSKLPFRPDQLIVPAGNRVDAAAAIGAHVNARACSHHDSAPAQ